MLIVEKLHKCSSFILEVLLEGTAEALYIYNFWFNNSYLRGAVYLFAYLDYLWFI